jgi:CheY-like chemotaxis protein
MPGKGGYEVLEELRSDPETSGLRIFILSNLGQDKEVEDGKMAGADDYLIKANLTPEQLTERVRSTLAHTPKGRQGDESEDKEDEPMPEPPHSGTRILLIEDDQNLQEMYALRLRQDGHHVSTAGNGAWGLRLANDHDYDVIIMDMMMPAMQGYELLDKMRAESRNRKTPVIVISNSAQDKDVEDAKRHGVSAYFLKSQTTPAKLSKEVDHLLNT